jgi:hypothetical protein
MATVYFDDPIPTTDPLSELEALATAGAALMASLYGSEINYVLTASGGVSGATGTGATTAASTAASTSTKSTSTADPYSITITDAGGDIVACSSELVLEYEGEASTACVGSVTTISKAPSTSTEVVVVTVTVHPTSTSTDVVIATPTPTGFGIMVFSDTECKDYINGYSYDEGKCWDVGTTIQSWIITTESSACDSNADAIYKFWYVSTSCEECKYSTPTLYLSRILEIILTEYVDDFVGGSCGEEGTKCEQNYFSGTAKYVIADLSFSDDDNKKRSIQNVTYVGED